MTASSIDSQQRRLDAYLKGFLRHPELVRDNLYAMWRNYDLREKQSLATPKTPECHPREFNPQTRCLCETDGIGGERDSRLTVRLTNDHRAITRDLERLRTSAGKLDIGDHSTEAVFFTQLAKSLNEHFRREEQLLFPLLSRSLGSGICDRLNNEHAEILGIAKKLSVQTPPLEDSLNHLEQLFHAHTSTEENVLFWYLDLHQPL